MKPLALCVLLVTVGCGDDDEMAIDAAVDAAAADARLDAAPMPDAAPMCGNGVLEGSEQCDTGPFNGMNACSATCDSVVFAVNTTTAGEQGAEVDVRTAGLDVAAAATSWIVVWTDASGVNTDIRTRIFARNGSPRSNGIDGTRNDFVANLRAGDQLGPRITPKNLSSDDFVVAWKEAGTPAQVRIREFGGDGTPSDITAGEANAGATDAAAVTALTTLGGVYVVSFREAANELRARRVMPGGQPLMPLDAQSTLFAMNTGVGAQLSLLPGQGANMWATIDRGAGDSILRVKYPVNTLMNATATGISVFHNLGGSRPFGHAEEIAASTGVLFSAPGTDMPARIERFAGDRAGMLSTVGTMTSAPAAAAGRDVFALAWIEKAGAGGRDQVRLLLLTSGGAVIQQPRYAPAADGSLVVSTRTTPAGANDLGVASPRVAVASDGSVLVVWRDWEASTGAATGAELRGRLFVRAIP